MAAHQAPPSLGFSRQEHWSGLPFPSPMRESELAPSCPTLLDPVDCSLPGSSIHGIVQARVLEWVAIAFSTVSIYWAPTVFQTGTVQCELLVACAYLHLNRVKLNLKYCSSTSLGTFQVLISPTWLVILYWTTQGWSMSRKFCHLLDTVLSALYPLMYLMFKKSLMNRTYPRGRGVVVESLSHVQLFATSWTAAC